MVQNLIRTLELLCLAKIVIVNCNVYFPIGKYETFDAVVWSCNLVICAELNAKKQNLIKNNILSSTRDIFLDISVDYTVTIGRFWIQT